ncbi:MarR family transcriptional regulator [Flavobacteriaceae bacterium AU392]|nr:MarR family transcriptional regulator [Flavobacteriaceae bacterium]RKM82745.1 MarR family transcriptional regulator [Flavobacteriaceae bacterium AU392]
MSIEDDLKTNKTLPLTTKTVVNLMYTSGFVFNSLTKALKPHDVTTQQFNVLRILRGQKGKGVTLATIQERMVNKMSNTTRLIDKLKQKQYVTRVLDKDNRRKVSISITKEGLSFLSSIEELIDNTEKEVTKNLTSQELIILNDFLEKIRQNSN